MNQDNLNCEHSIPQEEYTFPGLTPTSQCKIELQRTEKKCLPHRIIFWITLASFMIFMILTFVLWSMEWSKEFDNYKNVIEYQANYTGTIICAVLCSISIIVGIVNLTFSLKYNKVFRYLRTSIKVNAQYSAFISQGYSAKEAYKLTLEWMDRQASIAAIHRSAAVVSGSIAISQINNINNK